MLNVHQEIQGRAKEDYLSSLDASLKALAFQFSQMDNSIKQGQSSYLGSVKDFGKAHNWNWFRLPKNATAPAVFSEAVQRIREDYSWFANLTSESDPLKNRAFFDRLSISTSSGLPFDRDILRLENLCSSSEERLSELVGYDNLALQLKTALLGDEIKIEDLEDEAARLFDKALQRSFFEQLGSAKLLAAKINDYAEEPKIKKLMDAGGEELFSISFIRYRPHDAMFEVYLMDLWQDNREAIITKVENEELTEHYTMGQLRSDLWLARNAGAWNLLKTIDKRYASLHPVHLSRLLIGPNESIYRTNTKDIPSLAGTTEIISGDHFATFLRATHQYAFSPNHEMVDEEMRQVIYEEEWRDEYVVCPKEYAVEMSKKIEGESVKIIRI